LRQSYQRSRIELNMMLRTDPLNKIKPFPYIRIGHYHGAPIYFHWSAVALGVFILVMTTLGAWNILALGASFFTILIVHELGHALIAEHFKREVVDIKIYIMIGLTTYQYYDDPYEESAIAWGGPVAQMALFLPAVLWSSLVGYSSSDIFNDVIVMFSYWNALLIILNLIPLSPLDGKKAWPFFRHVYIRNRRSWY
jgi:Zn-dependent protease